MKALILVGGYGTRLRPLTFTMPKPMIPFMNCPMLEHQIEALVKIGVNHIILAVSYRPELMSGFIGELEEKYKISIDTSVEKEPLGTAGPIALARDLLIQTKEDEHTPFFVLNSDVVCDYPFQEMLEFHKSHGKEGTIAVTKVTDPTKYGVIVSDASTGMIQRFVEKPSVFVSNRINAGLYLFNTSIIKHIPYNVNTSIEKNTFPLMAMNEQLYAYDLKPKLAILISGELQKLQEAIPEPFWMDIGQPRDFLTGTELYLKFMHSEDQETAYNQIIKTNPTVKFIGKNKVHPSVTLGINCVIGPNVCIGPNVQIHDNVRIKNTCIFADCVVRSGAWINSSIIGWKSVIGCWARLDGASYPVVMGEDVVIKDEIYINGARILPNKEISVSVHTPEIIM